MIELSNKTLHKIGEPFTPDIRHIAKSLSNINRFNGYVGGYSVAQHCVLVGKMLPEHLKLSGLMHDATEAYLGDMMAPLKVHCPEFVKLESKYHDIIDAHYGVETRHKEVQEADLRMLLTEVESFGLTREWYPEVEPYPFTIKRMCPKEAEETFIRAFFWLSDLPKVRECLTKFKS